jgi:hypothetical protein
VSRPRTLRLVGIKSHAALNAAIKRAVMQFSVDDI